MQGYELLQSDYLSQRKRVDACIFSRNLPTLKMLDFHYLQDAMYAYCKVKRSSKTIGP